jgi:hypothetical protein
LGIFSNFPIKKVEPILFFFFSTSSTIHESSQTIAKSNRHPKAVNQTQNQNQPTGESKSKSTKPVNQNQNQPTGKSKSKSTHGESSSSAAHGFHRPHSHSKL